MDGKKIIRIAGIGSASKWDTLHEEHRELFRRAIGFVCERQLQSGADAYLDTGAAEGADQAAAEVALMCGAKVVLYQPSLTHQMQWRQSVQDRYPGKVTRKIYAGEPEWKKSVYQFHPLFSQQPNRCGSFVEALMARNYGILMDPKVNVCIALPSTPPDGGGTGQGLRIAAHYRIPTYNLSYEDENPMRPNEHGRAFLRNVLGDYQLPKPGGPKVHNIDVWTDGGCRGGMTGAGIVFRYVKDGTPMVKEYSIALGPGTNQTAELGAIIAAFKKLNDRPNTNLRVFTDSAYAMGFITPGSTWKAKANWDLVAEMKMLAAEFKSLEVVKTKGHADDQFNNRADVLAAEALAQ